MTETALSQYTVLVDDNFHHGDERKRYELGVFSTAEEAVAACKRIVDEDLEQFMKPGMTAAELYEMFTMFGVDPFVLADTNQEQTRFSAWNYAKEQSGLKAKK